MSTRKLHNRRQRLERNCRSLVRAIPDTVSLNESLADCIYDAMGAWPTQRAA